MISDEAVAAAVTLNHSDCRARAYSDQIEKAWLFEKITGPRCRFYSSREGALFNSRLEDFASVTIEGQAEATKFFSTAEK